VKIDRTRPRHWAYLAASTVNAALGLLLGAFAPRQRRRILLYGHKLGGNLLALYRELRARDGVEVAFLTMDPAYQRELAARGEAAVCSVSPRSIAWLARAGTLVSDHGLHSLQLLLGRSRMRFVDVWHGIPFKGFDAEDFRVQHRYDEAWVASPSQKALWVERFGFDPARVHATGYARTDVLVNPAPPRAGLQAAFGLERFGPARFVLFAPTWKQDAQARSLFPFGLAPGEFIERLAAACARHGAVLLLRTHLNSGDAAFALPANVAHLPYAAHPDTERLLLLADTLVCDWSSIAFDYLLLQRPTIFLDVEPPFRKGFSLGPEYRHGAIVASFEALLARLDAYLAQPARYEAEFGEHARAIRARVYGECADGRAARRGVERLLG
jgi:CDP-glycerol glycerophosphotransferase